MWWFTFDSSLSIQCSFNPAVNRPVAMRADNLFVSLVQKRFALKSYLILGLSKDNKYFIRKVLNFRNS
jgi:hypothetical protein